MPGPVCLGIRPRRVKSRPSDSIYVESPGPAISVPWGHFGHIPARDSRYSTCLHSTIRG